MDSKKALQDYYPDDYSHCYGCGCLNDDGLQIKSYWEKDECVCTFQPNKRYSGGKKEIVYGGLIASLIDCHGAATAAGAQARELGITIEKGNIPRFVTASLKVDYIAPTPVETELQLRGTIKELKGKKVTVGITLSAKDTICAKGELIMIQIKD
jgi:acyl-coenzyme A thioesterase PaaI-like protein